MANDLRNLHKKLVKLNYQGQKKFQSNEIQIFLRYVGTENLSFTRLELDDGSGRKCPEEKGGKLYKHQPKRPLRLPFPLKAN